MQGYLIERLYPTGWRRDGQLHWRYGDALAECGRAIHEELVRGVRVLAVRVLPDAIHELAQREALAP